MYCGLTEKMQESGAGINDRYARRMEDRFAGTKDENFNKKKIDLYHTSRSPGLRPISAVFPALSSSTYAEGRTGE